jgi:uncharacterized UBP type Zn finger protein
LLAKAGVLCKTLSLGEVLEPEQVERFVNLAGFASNVFQDAHELLMRILQSTPVDAQIPSARTVNDGEETVNMYTRANTAPIHQVTQVHLLTIEKCSSGHKTVRHASPEMVMSLAIETECDGQRTPLTTLSAVLEHAFSVDFREQACFQSECSESKRTITTRLMKPLPHCLILHFKRNRDNASKITHAVSLDDKLDVGGTSYELVAVVQAKPGHFVTYAKRQTRTAIQWYLYNDKRRSMSTSNIVLRGTGANIAFYRRA